MSEALTRTEPCLPEPMAFAGVTIALAPPMARHSLRARSPELLEQALGMTLPRKVGTSLAGAACLGPDEWLLRSDPAALALPQTTGLPVSIADVSERSVCLKLDGPGAAKVLAAGCPLDLDRFAVGRATRTVFETVEIVLLRTGESAFEVEVWRSFAPWLCEALAAAARQRR